MTGFLKTAEGLKLFYRHWEVPNPKAACFIVHGLGEHSGRYEALAQILTQNSYTVFGMDHRGHGRSEGLRGDCRSITEWVEDLHHFIETVVAPDHPLPRILLGHSLGGLVALWYAAHHGPTLKGVAVSSPALKLAQPPPRFKVVVAEGLARLLPTTILPNGVNPQSLSRDPAVVLAYEKDPLVNRGLTARCAVALRNAMAQASELAGRLKIPCLILQGGDDRICDAKAAYQFAKAAPPHTVTFHRYEGLYHELFNEPEKTQVIEDLCAWLKEQAG